MKPAMCMFDSSFTIPVSCSSRTLGLMRFLNREVDHGTKKMRFRSDAGGDALTLDIDSLIAVMLDQDACAQLFAVGIGVCVESITWAARNKESVGPLEQVQRDALYWLGHYASPNKLGGEKDKSDTMASPTAPIQCRAADESLRLTVDSQVLRFGSLKLERDVRFTVVAGTYFQFLFLLGKFLLRSSNIDSSAFKLFAGSLASALTRLESVNTFAPALIAELKLSKEPLRASGTTIQNVEPTAALPTSEELESSILATGKLMEAHMLLFARLTSTRLTSSHEPLWPGHAGLLFSH